MGRLDIKKILNTLVIFESLIVIRIFMKSC